MPKFRAKNNTTYRFSYVSKGDIISGGDDLRDNVNFEIVGDEGAKVATAPVSNGNIGSTGATGKVPYTELVKTAKEYGIKFQGVKYDALLALIAEAQAKAAAPNNGSDNPDNGGEDKNTDNAGDSGATGEEK